MITGKSLSVATVMMASHGTEKMQSPLGLIRDALDLSEAGHRLSVFAAKLKR